MMAQIDGLAKLREPFPPHQISKLPKETGAQAKQRKADQDNGKWPPKCAICEGYHHPKAVHLDYVGHAALTDRLLDVDPEWSWEPVALTPEGLPAFDRNGGLWIKLNVLGVSRIGYGAADGKSGGDAVKEIIGDALRNAAMRFGAALDLWHKGALHAEDEQEQAPQPQSEQPAPSSEPPQGWVEWVNGFREVLNGYQADGEITALQKRNSALLRALSLANPSLYAEIGNAIKTKRAELAPQQKAA